MQKKYLDKVKSGVAVVQLGGGGYFVQDFIEYLSEHLTWVSRYHFPPAGVVHKGAEGVDVPNF